MIEQVVGITSSLEDYKNNRNSFCGRLSVRGRVKQGETEVFRFARLRCKCWGCPRCGKRRVKQLRRAIIKSAIEHKLFRFLTLTLDHASCSPEESLPYLRKCWNKLRTYFKREYGESITFIAVVEPQKSGHAHLHILVDRYIPHAWIKRNWNAVGGGTIVHIKRADVHRVSRYISKYLTKELMLSGFFAKYRRYTTSRDIHLFEKTVKGAWTLIMASLERLLAILHDRILESQIDEETGQMEWFNSLDPI